MAYKKRSWRDRISEHPWRRRLLDVESGETHTVELERDEGAVHTEGDTLNAAALNGLEDRISTGFAEVDKSIEQQDSTLGALRNYTDEIAGSLGKHTSNLGNPHRISPGQIGAATQAELSAHTKATTNPHAVTAEQLGAVTPAQLEEHTTDLSNPHGVTLEMLGGASNAELAMHTANTANPHAVTAAQAGAYSTQQADAKFLHNSGTTAAPVLAGTARYAETAGGFGFYWTSIEAANLSIQSIPTNVSVVASMTGEVTSFFTNGANSTTSTMLFTKKGAATLDYAILPASISIDASTMGLGRYNVVNQDVQYYSPLATQRWVAHSAIAAAAAKTTGTLTITQDGTTKGTFNGSANQTIALDGDFPIEAPLQVGQNDSLVTDWYKVCTITPTAAASANYNYEIMLSPASGAAVGSGSIMHLKLAIRTGTGGTIDISNSSWSRLTSGKITSPPEIKFLASSTVAQSPISLYLRTPVPYTTYRAALLASFGRTSTQDILAKDAFKWGKTAEPISEPTTGTLITESVSDIFSDGGQLALAYFPADAGSANYWQKVIDVTMPSWSGENAELTFELSLMNTSASGEFSRKQALCRMSARTTSGGAIGTAGLTISAGADLVSYAAFNMLLVLSDTIPATVSLWMNAKSNYAGVKLRVITNTGLFNMGSHKTVVYSPGQSDAVTALPAGTVVEPIYEGQENSTTFRFRTLEDMQLQLLAADSDTAGVFTMDASLATSLNLSSSQRCYGMWWKGSNTSTQLTFRYGTEPMFVVVLFNPTTGAVTAIKNSNSYLYFNNQADMNEQLLSKSNNVSGTFYASAAITSILIGKDTDRASLGTWAKANETVVSLSFSLITQGTHYTVRYNPSTGAIGFLFDSENDLYFDTQDNMNARLLAKANNTSGTFYSDAAVTMILTKSGFLNGGRGTWTKSSNTNVDLFFQTGANPHFCTTRYNPTAGTVVTYTNSHDIYGVKTNPNTWTGTNTFSNPVNVATPTANTHAATKKYVDDKAGSNVASATKLQTARTIQTNLGSTSAASFNGTTNITPGVTGTLPVARGGTGNTTGTAANSTQLNGQAASYYATAASVTSLTSTVNNKASTADVLTKANTTAFTPTASYHPATKAYVDNATTAKLDKATYEKDKETLVTKQDVAGIPIVKNYSRTIALKKYGADTQLNGTTILYPPTGGTNGTSEWLLVGIRIKNAMGASIQLNNAHEQTATGTQSTGHYRLRSLYIASNYGYTAIINVFDFGEPDTYELTSTWIKI